MTYTLMNSRIWIEVRKFFEMSYQKKIEELVGSHVAEFQLKFTLAKKLGGHKYKPAMPYGYPIPVYRPMHICKVPQVRHFIAHTGGLLSNGVPKVLSMDIVGAYPLGVYHPAPR